MVNIYYGILFMYKEKQVIKLWGQWILEMHRKYVCLKYTHIIYECANINKN